MSELKFKPWPKIPRENKKQYIISEKIDGTNACIIIENGEVVGCQSRKRLITPEQDNHGFAAWVEENKEELKKMGDGYHYGEFAGPGIQKNPHRLEEKTLFLFNTLRWGEHNPNTPSCCEVVRVMYSGTGYGGMVDEAMERLRSIALDNEYVPEGVVVFEKATQTMTKATYAYQDGKWKKE